MPTTVTLKVENMKCAGCVSAVEQALLAVEGVESASVSLEDASAVVTGTADTSALITAATKAGYPASLA